jgi:DNA-binding Lrp family transcriptional regulator
MSLDELDRRIIRATQSGLPLVHRPYEAVGAALGISGEQVRERLQAMLSEGLIRRIGAVPNHYRLGFTANGMSVWDVADDRVDELGERIGQLPFVSHCYRRPRRAPKAALGRSQAALSPLGGDAAQSAAAGGYVWPYNLFAMLHGRSRDEVEAQAQQVAALLGDACRAHDILYSTAILKKTGLRISES